MTRRRLKLDEKTRQRIIGTMGWMVKSMKWREDDLRGNLEEGTNGGYSDELKEAMTLLKDLKERRI